MNVTYLRFAGDRDERRRTPAQTAQEAADLEEWRACCAAVIAVRNRYDPKNEWTEVTPLPAAYLEELAALHMRHKAMLLRLLAPVFAEDD